MGHHVATTGFHDTRDGNGPCLCHLMQGIPPKFKEIPFHDFLKTFSQPPWVSDPDMHHGTCVTHVPWCMPGSVITGFFWSQWRVNIPIIPGACATHSFTYLVRAHSTGMVRYVNHRNVFKIHLELQLLLPGTNVLIHLLDVRVHILCFVQSGLRKPKLC